MAKPPVTPTQNPDVAPFTATKYYTNCRGINYLPPMRSEWEKSGFLPRACILKFVPLTHVYFPDILPPSGASSCFYGVNKSTQWWYYDHGDNDYALSTLRSVGINAVRTFTNIYVWQRDRQKYWDAIEDFLKLAEKYKIRVQFVLWDGIGVEQTGAMYSIPTDNTQTVSSLEHGLLVGWQSIPHPFQATIGTPSGDHFYQNSAIPFITEFAQHASGYQSLWSFDLMNEGAGPESSGLVSSTALLVSSLLSSINIGITYGHAAGMNPFSGVLAGGRGLGPGGTYSEFPGAINTLSGVLNFATIHAYQNNQIARRGFVEGAVSASRMNGLPSMSNENAATTIGQFYHTDLSGFVDLNYGTMPFDAFIDHGLSVEPFLTIQGIFHWDGTTRDIRAVNAYNWAAERHGWLRPSQLKRDFVEKTISLDGGADGGYWSGVVPEHQEYNPTLYVSSSEALWTNVRNRLIYDGFATPNIPATIAPYANIPRSKNFAPYTGHEFASYGYQFAAEGTDTSGFIDMLYDWENIFPDLSSMPHATAAEFRAKDISLARRHTLLHILQISLGDQLIYWSELSGSQYDNSIIPTELQLEWSAAYYPLGGIGISQTGPKPYAGPTGDSFTQAECAVSSLCISTGGVISNTQDWYEYDKAFNTCKDLLRDIYDILLEAGNADPRRRLYP